MKDAWLKRSAVALAALTLVVSGVALWLVSRVPPDAPVVVGLTQAAALAMAWISFALVGSVIVSRHPRHPVGWLCVATGLWVGLYGLAREFAGFLLAGDRASEVGMAVAWLTHALALTPFAIVVFVLLLFPDGHLPSPRWRVVAMAALFGAAISVPASGLAATDLTGYPGLRNPIALAGVAGTVAFAGASVGWLLVAGSLIGAAVSLLARLRVAPADERRQLMWIAFAGSGIVLVIAFTPLISPDLLGGQASSLQYLLTGFAITGVAAAIGIAVLRYRLYDIDVIVDRAFVYGALTAILAGLYAASVRLFQALFTTVTGETSDAALVLTTLVLATSFTPIKGRLETIVARRYRPKGERPATDPGGLPSAQAELQLRLDGIDRTLAGIDDRLVVLESGKGTPAGARGS
jgi:hypothetical protein